MEVHQVYTAVYTRFSITLKIWNYSKQPVTERYSVTEKYI